jgi:hypothetical protein
MNHVFIWQMAYSQRHRNNTLVGSALLGQKTFGQMTFGQHANDILILSNVLTKYLSAKWIFFTKDTETTVELMPRFLVKKHFTQRHLTDEICVCN